MTKNTTQNSTAYGRAGFTLVDRMTMHQRLRFAKYTIQAYVEKSGNAAPEVVEVGCGYHGQNLLALAEIFPTATFTGLDLEVDSEVAHARVKLATIDLNKRKPKQRGHVILSLAVIEHLHQPLAHLQLLKSLCHPDGLICLTTPTPQLHLLWVALRALRLIHGEQSHVSYLTGEGLAQLAREAGLALREYRQFELGLNQFALLSPSANP
jgi:trans-aconitate methyltransferase